MGPQGKFLAEPLYITAQPADKRRLGFGSHDATRRDEFSNTVRTRQLREALSQEKSTFQRTGSRNNRHVPSQSDDATAARTCLTRVDHTRIERGADRNPRRHELRVPPRG